MDAQADPIIEYAIRLKDWPMLEEAVGKKLDEQTEYVRWWRETVDKGPTTLPAWPKTALELTLAHGDAIGVDRHASPALVRTAARSLLLGAAPAIGG